MPILGSTSVQLVTRSQIRPSPVSETMLRQNISTTFSLINAPFVKQLLGRKLLKIITWPDTTGKTNKYECYTLVFFFTCYSFKVLRRSPRNIHQKYGYHCWWRTCLGPFLAKTSRTAVLTAIMDLSAGGRLYKCLYKMHVDSRAFWGAFWGAFRVFIIDSPG